MHCLRLKNNRITARLIVLSCLTSSPVYAASVIPVPANEAVGKISRSEYVAKWWQWANRVPNGVRPYQDPTGSQCALNQSGEVWFLAGTDGTDEIKRNCKVPAGKYLFFPIIAMLVHAKPGESLTCEQAKADASGNNNYLLHAVVEIDGKQIKNIEQFRVSSPDCFDAFPEAPYIKKPTSYFPAASDGYWLMLKPLAPGMHRISVSARYHNPGRELGDLEQIFEYRLLVERSVPGQKKESKPAGTKEGLVARR